METDAAMLADKTKEWIKDESGRALSEIDAYVALATGNAYAAHDDIQGAIEASRVAQDAISEMKSAAILAIDNSIKELSQ